LASTTDTAACLVVALASTTDTAACLVVARTYLGLVPTLPSTAACLAVLL